MRQGTLAPARPHSRSPALKSERTGCLAYDKLCEVAKIQQNRALMWSMIAPQVGALTVSSSMRRGGWTAGAGAEAGHLGRPECEDRVSLSRHRKHQFQHRALWPYRR